MSDLSKEKWIKYIRRSRQRAKGGKEGERVKHTQRESIIYLEHAEDGGDVRDGGVIGPEVGVDVLGKAEPDRLLTPTRSENHIVHLADEHLVEREEEGETTRSETRKM